MTAGAIILVIAAASWVIYIPIFSTTLLGEMLGGGLLAAGIIIFAIQKFT